MFTLFGGGGRPIARPQVAFFGVAQPSPSLPLAPAKPIEVRKEFPQVWLWANSTEIKFVLFLFYFYKFVF